MEMSNGVVISGAAMLVGCALLLVLSVVWLDWMSEKQLTSSAQNTGSARFTPCDGDAKQSAPSLPVSTPIPDLRVYAVLRAARKTHTLPDLPHPPIVARLLASTDEVNCLDASFPAQALLPPARVDQLPITWHASAGGW